MSKQIYYRDEVSTMVGVSVANVVRNALFDPNMIDAAKIDTMKGAYALAAEIDKELERREKEEE